MGRLGWASRLLVATLVATSVISGVGAVPWVERSDSDGDGAEELGVEWNSLAGEAGAAASGAPGLSCPDGMVLDDGLCKTPRTETVPVTHVCPQAADGYVLVSDIDKLGESHSCQKTVPAHCTGDKILHEGKCRTAAVEHEPATWPCDVGTPVTSSGDQGVAHSCKIALDTPTCPTGQAYRTEGGAGCYRDDSYYKKRGYDWECSEGTLETASGDHGVSRSCKVALNPPQCPAGETYRNSRCEIEEDYYKTRGFDWGCSEGTRVTTSGDHGVSYSCRVALNPPTCPDGETYRNSRCEQQQDFYRTRGYAWTCSEGTRVTTSGDHGVSYSCRITLNPPTCPDGETYRTAPRKACYEKESYFDSAPLDYSCPATYTLRTSGTARSCSKVEKYRKRVCSFDPVAGQQCWWENRTRTVTTAVIESCRSGYSPDGTGCTADVASTRWKRTASTPTKYRYDDADKSCPTGYTDNGTQCQADTASQRWVVTASTPRRYRYDAAVRSCPTGYSDNGAQCESDTASQRWVVTASTPAKHRYDPAVKSCPTGYSDNGAQCQADTATPKWTLTASTPTTHRYEPADPQCTTAGFEYSAVASRCERAVYTDPTDPLTKLVGRTPTPTCPDGYTAAGAGRCERTVLGEPTRAPIGAECLDHLGTLGAGTVTRSGRLVAGTVTRGGTRVSGCVSLAKGEAQQPFWARRYSLYVSAASTATVTASSSAADVFVYVLSGTDGSVVVEDSDDDSGPDSDAEAAGVALAAGVLYTIEVTTSTAGPVGAFTLTVTTALDEPPVAVSGLADAAVTGRGTLTAADVFTVEPADAVCTAAAAGVTPSVTKTATPGERTVSVTLAAPFSHAVTVTCDADGRSPTSAVVTLAGRLPAVSVTDFEDATATATSRGLRYATDKITVDPPEASCSVRTAGRGVNRPWVSDRGPRRIVLAYLLRDGAAIVTVTCTAPDHSPGTAEALFSAQPRPQIGTVTAAFAPNNACTDTTAGQTDTEADAAHSCTLAEGGSLAVTLTATADSAAIATSWDTDSAITAAPGRARAATPVIGPDNAATGHWQRTATAALACTGDGAATATVTAGRYPADDTHTTRIGIDCEQRVRISGLADATGYSAAGTKAAVSDAFTVEPATADCTAAPTGTVTAPDPRRPQNRLLSAQIDAGTTTTVTVTCTDNGRADGTASAVLSGVAADCGDALGSLVHGVTVIRDGAVAADAGCTSAGRGVGGTFYARRHTFTLDAAARVSVDLAAASEAAPLDAYVVLYRGHDATAAAVLHSDDDSGPRSDSRLRNLRLGAGDYTIEATTATAQAVGGYRLGVRALYSSPVRISGLPDASGAGTGTVTVSEPFTVSPSTADCTAAPAAASVTAGSGRRRTVTATIDAPGPLPVTVTCTAAGRGPARQQATLTHAGALTTITARTITGGGECETARTRRGIDKAYRCRIGRGNTVTIAADAVATGPGIEIAWNTTGAITASGHRLGAATPTFGPDNSIAAWKRTATVDLACTSGGTATAKATLAGTTAKKTARLTVVCADAVQITGLADASAEGTGTVPVTRSFTVTPPTADCTADPAAATVTAGIGDARTLSARVTVPATLEAVVTCKADGYADAVRHVALTARRPCSTHLGTLATGTITHSGTITKGQCAAKARRTATESVFYAQGRHWAKRHTFTLDTPGWVTISLDNAPANTDPLDTYLILLKDNNNANTGTPIERNDNRSRRDTNARLTGIFLQPGSYTIEATTKTPRTAGGYDLVLEADVSGLADTYTATVGAPKAITFRYWPPQAQVAIKAAAAEEFGLTVKAANGVATITLTPRLVHDHEVTVRVSGDSAAGQLISFTLTARCPAAPSVPNGPALTLTTSPHNHVLCIKTGTRDPAPTGDDGNPVGLYHVTPGALNGVLESATAAVAAARAARPACGITANKLAAFMLSIGYREIPFPSLRHVQPNPARSPMTLGRYDTYTNLAFSEELRGRNKRLYSDNDPTSGPPRAHFHPGVGYWQLDDAGGTMPWVALNHGQRADTGLGLNGSYDSAHQDSGGEVIAKLHADAYCNGSASGAGERVRRFQASQWGACGYESYRDYLKAKKKWDALPDEERAMTPRPDYLNRCFRDVLPAIYLPRSDDLYVTIAHNPGQYGTAGGAKLSQCRWASSGASDSDPFDCWFYDTTRPEGKLQGDKPTGEMTAQSPLAAPFYSFSADHDGMRQRFAVFPGSVLSLWKRQDDEDYATRVKAVPFLRNVRNQEYKWADSPDLDRDGRFGKVLEAHVCGDQGWVLAAGDHGQCEWLSVDGTGFASRLGISPE